VARSVANHKALSGASLSAGRALAALSDPQCAHVPKEEVVAWAMAAVIHCDMCRLVVSLDECEPGLASLLAMSDVVSKLYEAKRWYLGQGAKSLRKIACRKVCGTAVVDDRLKELKSQHPIGSVDRYASYRNRVGNHYAEDTVEYLIRFGQEESLNFYTLLTTFVRFSGEWAKLTGTVLRDSAATS
jgi:hypothetical protein